MAERQHGAVPGVHDHEERDVQIRVLVIFGLGLVMMSILVFLIASWLFDAFAARRAKMEKPLSPLAGTWQPLAEPRLQVTPAQDLQKLRAAEQEVLSSYGWQDQTAGIVRLPITRAIDLLVERGLPTWNAPRAPQTKNQQTQP
jgi:hypothetical protein